MNDKIVRILEGLLVLAQHEQHPIHLVEIEKSPRELAIFCDDSLHRMQRIMTLNIDEINQMLYNLKTEPKQ